MQRSSVLLPLPLAPMTTSTSPGATSRLMPSSTRLSPKLLRTASRRMMASACDALVATAEPVVIDPSVARIQAPAVAKSTYPVPQGSRVARRAADPAGPERADVLVHAGERAAQRVEVALAEVLREVLLDPAPVDAPRRLKRLGALGRHDDLDRPPVGARRLPLIEPRGVRAVDDARERALAREDPRCEFVHAHGMLGLLEIHEHVVGAEVHAALRLELGVEDVDERVATLQEDPPDPEFF